MVLTYIIQHLNYKLFLATTTTPSLFGTPAQTTGLFSAPAYTASAPKLPFGGNTTFGATPAANTTTGLTFNTPASSAGNYSEN